MLAGSSLPPELLYATCSPSLALLAPPAGLLSGVSRKSAGSSSSATPPSLRACSYLREEEARPDVPLSFVVVTATFRHATSLCTGEAGSTANIRYRARLAPLRSLGKRIQATAPPLHRSSTNSKYVEFYKFVPAILALQVSLGALAVACKQRRDARLCRA